MFSRQAGLLGRLVVILGILGLTGLQAGAQTGQEDLEMVRLTRHLAPIGQLCLVGEDCAGQSGTAASPSSAAAAPAATSGGFDVANVYQMNCFACHSSGAAGAPRTGDAAAWNTRIQEKGMDTVIQNAINGIGAMPARGLCMSCSDDNIRSLVDYMIEGGQ